MTKKDFEIIAETIASMGGPWIRKQAAEAFVKRLSREFPRFDPLRFIAACKIGDEDLDT